MRINCREVAGIETGALLQVSTNRQRDHGRRHSVTQDERVARHVGSAANAQDLRGGIAFGDSLRGVINLEAAKQSADAEDAGTLGNAGRLENLAPAAT